VYGPNTSLNYGDPAALHVVRGEGARLFDAEGRAYLDCVNNVAHVGHANPAVGRRRRRPWRAAPRHGQGGARAS
jgi:4-aminobutyrate aminotransferase-like enzyme